MGIVIGFVLFIAVLWVVKMLCIGFIKGWEALSNACEPKKKEYKGNTWMPSSDDFARARAEGRDIYF